MRNAIAVASLHYALSSIFKHPCNAHAAYLVVEYTIFYVRQGHFWDSSLSSCVVMIFDFASPLEHGFRRLSVGTLREVPTYARIVTATSLYSTEIRSPASVHSKGKI